jgi:hypothetical protein
MELLLRIAEEKFMKYNNTMKYSEAFKLFYNNHL